MTSPIPLAEQIAAVERALVTTQGWVKNLPNSLGCAVEEEADRLAAALATLRGLQKESEMPPLRRYCGICESTECKGGHL